jgi:hypothetical protein
VPVSRHFIDLPATGSKPLSEAVLATCGYHISAQLTANLRNDLGCRLAWLDE